MIHASPDGEGLDLFFDAYRRYEGLQFRDVTRYAFIAESQVQVTVVPSGADRSEALLQRTLTLEPGADYTLAVTNRVEDLGLTLFEDVNQQPSVGSRFRAVHLSPDAPQLDVDEQDLFSFDDFIARDLGFRSASGYEGMLAGDLCFEVEPSDRWGDNDYVEYSGSFEGGQTYTLFVVGLVEPTGDEPGIQLLAVRDT
ncbi:MAG: DUF4397 domain-containing protein [Halorientalis sp.]